VAHGCQPVDWNGPGMANAVLSPRRWGPWAASRHSYIPGLQRVVPATIDQFELCGATSSPASSLDTELGHLCSHGSAELGFLAAGQLLRLVPRLWGICSHGFSSWYLALFYSLLRKLLYNLWQWSIASCFLHWLQFCSYICCATPS
jgi:hypothetical protein